MPVMTIWRTGSALTVHDDNFLLAYYSIIGGLLLADYLVVPPPDISRTRPLIRLILNQIGRRLTGSLDGDGHDSRTGNGRDTTGRDVEQPNAPARDYFMYSSGKDPSAVRYKNWKMYFAMVSDDPAGFITGVQPYHWTQIVNIKRDPFETSTGEQIKTLMSVGGAIAAPMTAYQYDWNILPIGQQLWLRELETYRDFPPMQDPSSYNLDQVMQQVKNMKTISHAGH